MAGRHEQSLEYAMGILLGKYREYIREIRLYGSFARGEQKDTSDADLMVRVTEETPPCLMRKMSADAAPEDPDLPAVGLKFTADPELYSGSFRFNENIKKEGKTLWKAD